MEHVEVYLVEPLENFQVELPTEILARSPKRFHLEEFTTDMGEEGIHRGTPRITSNGVLSRISG